MICKKCGKEFFDDWRKLKNSTLPNFCSRSCSNGNNHTKYREIRFCLTCSKPIGSGYYYRNRKYCSNKCQAVMRQNILLKKWLETGRLTKSTSKSANSSSNDFVRSYILKDQNNVCAICKNPFVWMNKPLVSILDHVNGCCLDNKRENLRLICSNCDSQLSTYKGRNKGKGRRSLGFEANKGL